MHLTLDVDFRKNILSGSVDFTAEVLEDGFEWYHPSKPHTRDAKMVELMQRVVLWLQAHPHPRSCGEPALDSLLPSVLRRR